MSHAFGRWGSRWTPDRIHRLLRLLRRTVVIGTALALLVVVGAAVALRAEYAGNPAAAGRTRGHDALWLGHAWVDGRRTAADLAGLRARVAGTGIRDLYVHTGPLAHDGSLDRSLYPGAAAFLADVHRELPGVRVQAWLGDVVDQPGAPGLRLGDAAVREQVVESGTQVLDAGFDGVHFDLEPVSSGDGGFLALLDAMHTVTESRGVPLSAAAPQIDPTPVLRGRTPFSLATVSRVVFRHPKWWSQDYFGQVARRVDQIAVMAYDTSMPAESLYGGYVAQQTGLALDAAPVSTNLVIGLPAYHTSNMGHHAYAETVAAAVRGARVSLARTAPARRTFGLALYVDFDATDGDWAAYRSGWGAP